MVKKLPEIDFTAALGHPQETTSPKRCPGRPRKQPRGRGRPRGSKTKPKNPQYKNNNILYDNKSVLNEGDLLSDISKLDDVNKSEEVKSAKNLKDQMTEKELKFLELYMTGDYTLEMAMLSAGYNGYSKSGLYYIAGKICNKYESQADDHRKLFREFGAGEVLVIKTLLSLIKTSKSEKIRLDAARDLAKCLGLTKDQIEAAAGLTVIFEAPDAPATPVGGQAPPPLGEPKPSAALPQGRALMITK